MPFKNTFKITSGFGERILNGKKDFHNGVDLVGVGDINVYSCMSGRVKLSAYGTQCGNQIEIITENNKLLFFCHLKQRFVESGDIVKKGQLIGVMGNTGTKCFGAHLHFGVYEGNIRNDKYVLNAQEFLNL